MLKNLSTTVALICLQRRVDWVWVKDQVMPFEGVRVTESLLTDRAPSGLPRLRLSVRLLLLMLDESRAGRGHRSKGRKRNETRRWKGTERVGAEDERKGERVETLKQAREAHCATTEQRAKGSA